MKGFMMHLIEVFFEAIKPCSIKCLEKGGAIGVAITLGFFILGSILLFVLTGVFMLIGPYLPFISNIVNYNIASCIVRRQKLASISEDDITKVQQRLNAKPLWFWQRMFPCMISVDQFDGKSEKAD